MARIATILPSPASRVWRGHCGRLLRSSARRGRGAIHQGSARRLIGWYSAERKMPVYTVHAPATHNLDFRAADRFTFVRDGFHLWAALLGVVWLAWNRLWLALIGWIVLLTALDVAMIRLGVDAGLVFLVDCLLALLL